MSRKKKDRIYYGEEQELAVVLFLKAKTISEKEKIYREHLQEPINKMIESIIQTYRLHRKSYEFNDLHADALSFLITKFDKFDPDKGYKSYSYFGTICKNYLYNEMIKEYKKNTSFIDIGDTDYEFLNRDELLYNIDEPAIDLTAFIDELISNIELELIDHTKLTENEFKVGHAIVKVLEEWKELFDKPNNNKPSSKFNKNLVLLYIRNITGLNTKEIRNAMRRFKSLYYVFKNKYYDE